MFVGWLIFASVEAGEGFVAQQWRWLCVASNGGSRVAEQGFATLPACRADALKHGLNPDAALQIDARCPMSSVDLEPYASHPAARGAGCVYGKT
jgi:hypothetical protein